MGLNRTANTLKKEANLCEQPDFERDIKKIKKSSKSNEEEIQEVSNYFKKVMLRLIRNEKI